MYCFIKQAFLSPSLGMKTVYIVEIYKEISFMYAVCLVLD